MSSLHHYLKAINHFLDHCQQHLEPHEWKIFTRRLVGTPLEQGYSVQERWTAHMILEYYWPRLSRQEQAAFLRKQRLASKRQDTRRSRHARAS